MIPILGTILEIFGKVIPDQDKQAELAKALDDNKVKIESAFAEYAKQDVELRIKELEANGFKAWWRPFAMFGFSSIVILYCLIYYIFPGLVVYFNLNVWIPDAPVVDPALWELVMYSILGIGGMRTIDKWRK